MKRNCVYHWKNPTQTNVESKVMELRKQLHSLRKDNISISQYMMKVKTVFGRLSSIVEQLSKIYIVHYGLEGLGPYYLYFVSNINMRETWPSITTLHSLLEGYERSLAKQSNSNQRSWFLPKVTKVNNFMNDGNFSGVINLQIT